MGAEAWQQSAARRHRALREQSGPVRQSFRRLPDALENLLSLPDLEPPEGGAARRELSAL